MNSSKLPELYFESVSSTQQLQRVSLPPSFRELKSKDVSYSVSDEHYLRDDLPCPILQCEHPRCVQGRNTASMVSLARDSAHKARYIDTSSRSRSNPKESSQRAHICILSTNTLAYYIDLLNSEMFRSVKCGGYIVLNSSTQMLDETFGFPWKKLRKDILGDPSHPTMLWRDDLVPVLYPLCMRSVHASALTNSLAFAKYRVDEENLESTLGRSPIAGSEAIDSYLATLGAAQWLAGHVKQAQNLSSLTPNEELALGNSFCHDVMFMNGEAWKAIYDKNEPILNQQTDSTQKASLNTASTLFIQREQERLHKKSINNEYSTVNPAKSSQSLDVIVLDSVLADAMRQLRRNKKLNAPLGDTVNIRCLSVLEYLCDYLQLPLSEDTKIQVQAVIDTEESSLRDNFIAISELNTKQKSVQMLGKAISGSLQTLLVDQNDFKNSSSFPVFDFVTKFNLLDDVQREGTQKSLMARFSHIVTSGEDSSGLLSSRGLLDSYPSKLTRRVVMNILQRQDGADTLDESFYQDDPEEQLAISFCDPLQMTDEVDSNEPEWVKGIKSSSFSFRPRKLLQHMGHVFPPHLPSSIVQEGLRKTFFFEGTLQMQRRGVSSQGLPEAIVILRKRLPMKYGGGMQIAIQDRFACNRAFDGDLVAVALENYSSLSAIESKTKNTPDVSFERDDEEEGGGLRLNGGEEESSGDEDTIETFGQGLGSKESFPELESKENENKSLSAIRRVATTNLPKGRVVDIIERRSEYLVGTLLAEDNDKVELGWVKQVGDSASRRVQEELGEEQEIKVSESQNVRSSRYYSVVPMNARQPIVRIQTRHPEKLKGQRLLIHIDRWSPDNVHPTGHYVRALGVVGDVETEGEALIAALGLDYQPFDKTMTEHIPDRSEIHLKLADHNKNRKLTKELILSGKTSYDENDRQLVMEGSEPTDADPENPFLWNIPASLIKGRRDLRKTHGECLLSIDPPGCVDIDDALSVKKFSSLADAKQNKVPDDVLKRLFEGSKGGDSESLIAYLTEVGVHIADVSLWVPEDDALDMEARKRGTSTYLVGRRFDMLPRALSEDLSSLRGGCDRLAVSVLIYIDERTSEIIGSWIGRTVVHNYFAASYEQAQEMVDNDPDICYTFPASQAISSKFIAHTETSEEMFASMKQGIWPRYRSYSSTQPYQPRQHRLLRPAVSFLRDYGRVLKKRRLDSGALELASAFADFALDEQRRALGFKQHVEIELHDTIAEFMILANAIVAEKVFKAMPSCALLRSHGAPQLSLLGDLQRACTLYGVSLDATSNKALAASLNDGARRVLREALSGDVDGAGAIFVLKSLATRAMTEAQYHSTGTVGDPQALFHYGLAIPLYTHFTSPIRRYADLVVHRQILRVIGEEKVGIGLKKQSENLSDLTQWNNDFIEDIALNLNRKNRAAKAASKQSQAMYLVVYLASLLSHECARKGIERLMHSQKLEERLVSKVPKILTTQKSFLRASGVVEAILEGGRKLRVFLPDYQVTAEVEVVDEHSKLMFSPFQRVRKDEAQGENQNNDDGDEDEYVWRPDVVYNSQSDGTNLSIEIPSKADVKKLSQVFGMASTPQKMTFKLFSKVVIDLFVTRKHLSKFYYRIPTPQARWVWCHHSTQMSSLSSTLNGPEPDKKEVVSLAKGTARALDSKSTSITKSSINLVEVEERTFTTTLVDGKPLISKRHLNAWSRFTGPDHLEVIDISTEVSRLQAILRKLNPSQASQKQQAGDNKNQDNSLPRPRIHASAGRRYFLCPNLKTGETPSKHAPTPPFTKSKRKTIISESIEMESMKPIERATDNENGPGQINGGMENRALVQNSSHEERKVLTAARKAGISIRNDYGSEDYDPIHRMIKAGFGTNYHANLNWASEEELEGLRGSTNNEEEEDSENARFYSQQHFEQQDSGFSRIKAFSKADEDIESLDARLMRLGLGDAFAIAEDIEEDNSE